MRKALAVFVFGLSFGAFYAVAGAQQLPKSGSINFHTGAKDTVTATEVADKRMQGQGAFFGATFNETLRRG